MAIHLIGKKCVACEGGTPPFTPTQIKEYLASLTTPWEVMEEKRIRKEFRFKDFVEAMAFVNKTASLAESEGHHPDIHVFYNRVVIELWTHAVGGLTENDFILAAKIEQITKHYICTGGCHGISNTPGVCQAKTCPLHGKELKPCTCSDGKHEEMSKG